MGTRPRLRIYCIKNQTNYPFRGATRAVQLQLNAMVSLARHTLISSSKWSSSEKLEASDVSDVSELRRSSSIPVSAKGTVCSCPGSAAPAHTGGSGSVGTGTDGRSQCVICCIICARWCPTRPSLQCACWSISFLRLNTSHRSRAVSFSSSDLCSARALKRDSRP